MADANTNPLTALSDALADAVEVAGRSIVTVAARRRLPATGIAWEAAGVVVTADHVLEREDDITVVLPGGGEVKATIAGGAPDNKLGSTIMGSVEAVRFVCPSPLSADLDEDGSVDGSDLGILLGAWGDMGGDLNGDGTTDGLDLGLLLGAWTG
mgnify:CR=1 FL=1